MNRVFEHLEDLVVVLAVTSTSIPPMFLLIIDSKVQFTNAHTYNHVRTQIKTSSLAVYVYFPPQPDVSCLPALAAKPSFRTCCFLCVFFPTKDSTAGCPPSALRCAGV